MKKLIALMFLLVFFIPVMVFATASSIGVVSDTTIMGSNFRVVKIKFTASSVDGSVSNLILYAGGNYTSTSGLNKPLLGWSLNSVHIDGNHAGAHDGAADAAVLTDTDAGWDPGEWIGYTVTNSSDSSTATITANTSSTITGTLSGGSQNDWDIGDTYTISTEPTNDSDLYIYQKGVDILGAVGVDLIDNTANRDIYPYVSGGYALRPILGDLTVVVTQAATATNSAVGFLYLNLVK